MLAEMDALHGTVSGPATKKLMARALLLFGDARFERLAGISGPICTIYAAGHRPSARGRHWTKTRAYRCAHRQRRASQPTARQAISASTVLHQGDQDGVTGGYHINRWIA